ncbi:MAG: hypothetical protein ACHRXM_16495 [Isosphaerales bacterium]
MRNNPFGPWATALSPMSGARLSTFWLKRLSMLRHLRQSLPIVSRRGRYGLLALGLLAVVMPSLRGTTTTRQSAVDRQDAQGAAKSTSRVDTDEESLKEFLQIYHLVPGQDLKRIEPPRPDGMRVYWKMKHPGREDDLVHIAAMTFQWRDPDQLQSWSQRYAGGIGWPLRTLPKYLEMGVYSTDIEGDPKLLETEVSGDWVYRVGVPDERMAAALESILQRALRLRISVKFRQVERDVVVAHGRYRHSPVAGRSKNQVEIYGKQIVPNGGGAGGGTGKFPEFLKWVAEWIERPVVSEVEAPPNESIEWFYNARSPFTQQMKREDHDESLVLQHLQEQTGLTFTREKKPIRVLFIERAK